MLLFPSRTCQWSFRIATNLKITRIWVLNLLFKMWFIILILGFNFLFLFDSINIGTLLRSDTLCIIIRFFVRRILTILSRNVFWKIYKEMLSMRNLPLNTYLIAKVISGMRLTCLQSAYLAFNNSARFSLDRLLAFKIIKVCVLTYRSPLTCFVCFRCSHMFKCLFFRVNFIGHHDVLHLILQILFHHKQRLSWNGTALAIIWCAFSSVQLSRFLNELWFVGFRLIIYRGHYNNYTNEISIYLLNFSAYRSG